MEQSRIPVPPDGVIYYATNFRNRSEWDPGKPNPNKPKNADKSANLLKVGWGWLYGDGTFDKAWSVDIGMNRNGVIVDEINIPGEKWRGDIRIHMAFFWITQGCVGIAAPSGLEDDPILRENRLKFRNILEGLLSGQNNREVPAAEAIPVIVRWNSDVPLLNVQQASAVPSTPVATTPKRLPFWKRLFGI